MVATRWVWVYVSVLGGAASAFAGPCQDAFAMCREDCLIEYGGSIRTEMQKAFNKCAGKCTKEQDLCLEREHDITSNQLDESAMKKKEPSADESAPPSRASKANDAAEAPPVEKPAPARTNRDEKPSKTPVKEDPAPMVREEPRVDRSEKTSAPEKAERPEKVEKPAPAKPSFVEEDLRDDRPAPSKSKSNSRDEYETPRREEPRREEKRESKQADLGDDDLKNY